MLTRVAGLAATVLLAWGTPADGAQPVPGGRYVGHATARPGATVRIDLRLANDGKEFATYSAVDMEVACGNAEWITTLILSSDDYSQFASTPVRSNGRFRYARPEGRVRGRFIRRGRAVVGTAILPDAGRCGPVKWRFRVRLTGRPNAAVPGSPSRCDRVTVRYSRRLDSDEAYDVAESGFGCTVARRIARRWHRSPACALVALGASCALRGAVCQRVRGGAFDALASVRCHDPTQPAAVAEIVHEFPCAPPPDDREDSKYAWAVNLNCSAVTTFPVLTLVGGEGFDEGACGVFWDFAGRVTCAPAAGFTCTIEERINGSDYGFEARCNDQLDGFRAFRLEYFLPV